MNWTLRNCRWIPCWFVVCLLISAAFAQETTGGLQGTVRDPSGAVVSKAKIELTGTSLVGAKSLETDGSGYYRFSNLPPGTYAISVSAGGFTQLRREGITIEVGHLPTLDLQLQVGASTTVVEVSGEAPIIDVATTRTITNITPDVVADVPHGISYQSVIQFAPAARNEPLMGNNSPGGTGAGAFIRAGTGGGSAGSNSNGNGFGYQVGGGADSENRYLVEGQDTSNVIGGYSHSDVPFDFIDQVEIKSSGIEAEHGGAMGGVVNVIMKHGSNSWHGSLGTDFQSSGLNANQNNPFIYYNFQDPGNAAAGQDPQPLTYTQRPDHTRYIQPAFTIGGPILKDRVWLFLGFDPKYTSQNRTINFGTNDSNAGIQTFNQDTQTYFTTARIDATLTQKVRVFGSWLYQLQRQSGTVLPIGDSTTGYANPSASQPLFIFEHGYGFTAPNATYNFGADITITPKLIATSRFGYFFENYHDFGYPQGGSLYNWVAPGTTGVAPGAGGVFQNCTPAPCTPSVTLPLSLQQPGGFFSEGFDQSFTVRNASKHHQFDQDVAWFKGTRWGTHNFKFGYQLNQVSNDVSQRYSAPYLQIFPGSGQFFSPAGSTGATNCAQFIALYGGCAGLYGYVNAYDYGSLGKASSYNHSFYAQDAWAIGRGITINAGLRVEKEYLPGETTAGGFPARPINFGWGDKIAPRIGAAWDVFRDGRMKVFGSYGVFNDLMKLNLAISSFGGQYWQNCFYALNTPNISSLDLAFGSDGRYCNGSSSSGANWASGATPAGLTFLENQNFRGTEGVVPGLKPYRQHESVFGVDYALRKNLALEARWDRRRLDHAIEDAALFEPDGSENFEIVNPGFGPNATNTLCGALCPPNVPAARSYDGVEFRLTKAASNHWFGMVSYTYSNLRGNYSGLTSSDLADGGGGRNAPNNSRAFDETFFQYDAYGRSSSGPLGTDRPNVIKGYGYYQIPWKGGWTTTNIGWFQTMYEGTPMSTYVDVGFSFDQPPFSGGFPIYPEGRGKWANISLAPNASGFLTPTVTSVCSCRTPWFNQSDASFSQEFKPNRNNEAQVLRFEANFTNLLNERTPTAFISQLDTQQFQSFLTPGGTTIGSAQAYSAYEHPYPWKSLIQSPNDAGVPFVTNSMYGKPTYFQTARGIRLSVRYTF
jgi:Carboxypeptidase regulatory-like domain